MNRNTQRIVILVLLLCKIILGIWDLVTDIIYTCSVNFHQQYIKYLMIFFLSITPFIMLITWSVTLGKIKLEQNKNMEKERKKREMYLVNSGGLMEFIYRLIKVSIEDNYVLFTYSIRQILRALAITVLQTLKVFPFFIIAYTFKKFEVVITPELLKYAASQTTLYKKVMMDQQRQSQSYDEENQIHNYLSHQSMKSGYSGSNENINQILEVNIRPTFLQIAEDRTLKKLIEINEIFISIFEAMPMSVLQFINNYDLNQWYHKDGSLNWFIILSFVSSVASVFYNIFILSHWMFDTEIKSFFDLLTCMMESQKGRKEEKVKKVFAFFDIPAKVLITSQTQLKKMALLKPDRYERIRQLHIHLPNHKNDFDLLLADMYKILQNLKVKIQTLDSFSLNLSGCNMNEKQTKELVKQIRQIEAECKYVNVKQQQNNQSVDLSQSALLIDRTLNMKHSANAFLFSDQFLLARITDSQKMAHLYNFLLAHSIAPISLDNIKLKYNTFVNIHQDQEYSMLQLKNFLEEKEESVIQLNIRLNGQNRNFHFITEENYPLCFPQYQETIHYLQIHASQEIEFKNLFKQILNNLVDSYNQGVVINANLQFNQTATQQELLQYYLQLYKLDSNIKVQNGDDFGGTKFIQENEELDFSNMLNYENEQLTTIKVISNGERINQINSHQQLNKMNSLFVNNQPHQITEETKISEKILFQRIKIDDAILIGCSKALFNANDLLTYLRNEEGNYSCLFFFFDFGLPQEFILKLQAQLKDYFHQMNNLRYLHLIIGESGSFFINLNEHFTFIENVLVFQNDLFQFKSSLQKKNPLEIDEEECNNNNINSNDSQPFRIFTYADLISDTYEVDLQIEQSDPYAQIILKTARKGLDIQKYAIQSEIQQIQSQRNTSFKTLYGKLTPNSAKLNKEEVYLPLDLPPLCARLLPHALKQMYGIKKLSIYDNIDVEIQDFLNQNSQTIEYLKFKNSKIQRCICGAKHSKNISSSSQINQGENSNKCSEQNTVSSLDGIVYRRYQEQVIDISSLKNLKHLNISQSLMHQIFDFNHLTSSITNLSDKLQVVILGFDHSSIHFGKQFQDYLCNTCILHTFELNAANSYKIIGLDNIIKGLSFNFLIKNIGIRLSSHQITQLDMDLLTDLLNKRRTKGELKLFKFYLKKQSSMKRNNMQVSTEQLLSFFNCIIEKLIHIKQLEKVYLAFASFKTIIKYSDLSHLPTLLFGEKHYKKIKINLVGNIISKNFNLTEQYHSPQNVQLNLNDQKLIFKSDMSEQVSDNHLLNKILDIEYPNKVLLLSQVILNQNENRINITGQRIYLNIIAEDSMHKINEIKFNQNLIQLMLDFSQNSNINSDQIISFLQQLRIENESIQYISLQIPIKINNSNEIASIKRVLRQFKHFSPNKFIIK